MNTAYGRDKMHTKFLVKRFEWKRARGTDTINTTVM
jgi:hypothetical protein